jgi:hypothetical protein
MRALIATVLAIGLSVVTVGPAQAAPTTPTPTGSEPSAVHATTSELVVLDEFTTLDLRTGVIMTKAGTFAPSGAMSVNAAEADIGKIARCAWGITAALVSTVFVVFKGAKAIKAVNAGRKWVNSVGGPRTAAQLLTRATTEAEKARVLESAKRVAGASVLDFLGITQIQEGCF